MCLSALLLLGPSCTRQNGNTGSGTPKQPTRPYTQAELDLLIVPGMTETELTNKVGPAMSRRVFKDNNTLLTFLFPFKIAATSQLVGFDVHMVGDKVASWAAITAGPVKRLETDPNASANVEQRPSSQPSPRGREHMEVAAPLAFYVHEVNAGASARTNDPALLVSTIEVVGAEPAQRRITVKLLASDAESLQKLTADNVGKMLMVAQGSNIISSAMIVVPIGRAPFMVPVGTNANFERTCQELLALSRR
jgi:hypothetical protein